MTDSTRKSVAQLISDLKRQRDELRLQIHLGAEELKDEWNKLDARLDELKRQFDPVKDAMEDSAEDVWASLKLVAEEVRDGFQRIRKSLH